MKKVKIGIVGCGNIGTAHCNSIFSEKIKNLELTAVCDVDLNKNDFVKQHYPTVKFYEHYFDLLEDREVDAVLIATPHPLHADMCIQALKHNKHVLCEKPIDISVSKAKSINKIAQDSDKAFGIMLNQRTDYLFQQAKTIIESGQIGQMLRNSWTVTNWFRTQAYYDSSDWRATWSGEGGGVLLNQAPHNLDIWQWICGMPKSIMAFCEAGKYHNIEVEDEATIFAKYPNGATGVFVTSTGEYPGTNRFEIVGTKGKMVLENSKMKLIKTQESSSTIIETSKENYPTSTVEEVVVTECDDDKPQSAHEIILQNFTNHILYGENLIAQGIEGINELSISNAAYLSSWKGNSIVTLPIQEEAFDDALQHMQSTSNKAKSPSCVNTKPASVDGYSKRWGVNW